MSRATLLATVRAWIAAALPSLTQVVLELDGDFDNPRAALPYASIKLATDRALSATPYEDQTDTLVEPDPALYELHVSEQRTATLEVNLWGEGAHDRAVTLQRSPATPTGRAILRAASVGVAPLGSILEAPARRDTVNEPHVQLDFRLIYVAGEVIASPTIETVSVGGFM
ncbi:MAG: hypothetical protein COW42_13980 [Deltaproteobacteria bacterium CG17_big_fil_post_rev_8_21_14_2_50_63_7]|nr:MAG: hypothetical protein COW42_13980 [Deltaproteobacteria bacterium CG17_big_fil_post_rev_8_21_14_2_50_63_7]